MIVHTNIPVLTGPEWLVSMVDGQYSPNGLSRIDVGRDAYGRPVVGASIMNNPDWQGFGSQIINGKPMEEWWEVITYSYNDEEP